MKRVWIWFFLAACIEEAAAQTDRSSQLWGELIANYPFANAFNLEAAFTYSTNFENPKWRSFELAPTLEYSLTENIDFSGGLVMSTVVQNDTNNTFELRPRVGIRVHFTPNRRANIRLYARVEQRNFKDLQTNEWTHSVRFRIRPELQLTLNGDGPVQDNQWYLIADAEWFITADREVDERFANRFRARLGLGYRLDARWRFEGMYMQQQSKNKIGEDFYTSDDVVRVRIKFYFRKSRQ